MPTSSRTDVGSPVQPAAVGAYVPGRVLFLDVLAATVAVTGVDAEAIMGRGRSAHVAWARHSLCRVARDLTDMSLKEIGAAVGGRDHTTVLHSCDEAMRRDERDNGYSRQLDAIVAAVNAAPKRHARGVAPVWLSRSERRTVAIALRDQGMGSAQLRGKFDG